jgi:hypothetical protein
MNFVSRHRRGGEEENKRKKKGRASIRVVAGAALFGMGFVTFFYLVF